METCLVLGQIGLALEIFEYGTHHTFEISWRESLAVLFSTAVYFLFSFAVLYVSGEPILLWEHCVTMTIVQLMLTLSQHAEVLQTDHYGHAKERRKYAHFANMCLILLFHQYLSWPRVRRDGCWVPALSISFLICSGGILFLKSMQYIEQPSVDTQLAALTLFALSCTAFSYVFHGIGVFGSFAAGVVLATMRHESQKVFDAWKLLKCFFLFFFCLDLLYPLSWTSFDQTTLPYAIYFCAARFIVISVDVLVEKHLRISRLKFNLTMYLFAFSFIQKCRHWNILNEQQYFVWLIEMLCEFCLFGAWKCFLLVKQLQLVLDGIH